MEEGQTPDSMEGDQHFDQKLFMLCFQWQSKTIDYTKKKTGEREEKKYEHKWNRKTWKSLTEIILSKWRREDQEGKCSPDESDLIKENRHDEAFGLQIPKNNAALTLGFMFHKQT